MGKKKNNKPKKTKEYPFVSVCTPTFNRRPFIPIMFECFKNQDYPKSRIEWIIIDDGTDKIEDLIEEANIPQIKYFKYDEKMVLGKKRNLMHEKSTGSIIVYMDDDDYYPPTRISHSVSMLQLHKNALCAGSSIIHVHFKHINKIIEFGPYGPSHSTAGTFAFKRKLLDVTEYDESAALAEEKKFLKDYTIPFVQLDPKQTILVFSHEHNTFDKRKLLENPMSKVMKETTYKPSDFIKEENIKQFFINDIEELLQKYEPGKPDMKPDVLKQMKEMEIERANKLKEMQSQNENGPIMVQEPGKEPRPLKTSEILHILQTKDKQLENNKKIVEIKEDEINTLNNKNKELVSKNEEFVKIIFELNEKISYLENKN